VGDPTSLTAGKATDGEEEGAQTSSVEGRVRRMVGYGKTPSTTESSCDAAPARIAFTHILAGIPSVPIRVQVHL
jgi:hypothetical protein